MKEIAITTVEERMRNGYHINFGHYLNEAFEIFKKEWLLFSLYSVVFMLMTVVSAITIVGPFLIMYPGLLGFAVAAEKVERGEKLEFNDFFGAFKNFGNYAILMLVVVGISVLLYMPFLALTFLTGGFNSGYTEPNPLFLTLFMLYYFVMIAGALLLQVSIVFAPYLIHYGGYGAIDALKTSFKLAKKNFWWLLLFVLLASVISSVGYFLCFIGVFASMAVGYTMYYSMVKDILMNPDHTEIEQIGKHGYAN
ncbi:MAG: hypothetical protein WCY25_01885 [Moheibacter sp.]